MPLLQLAGRRLQAERGGRILFSGLSFTLKSGQLLALSGANGLGKSTLLRLLADLCPPLAGAVRLSALPAAKAAAIAANELPRALFCHYLSAENAMLPRLSVRRNLQFWQDFFNPGSSDKAAAAENLAKALRAVRMSAYADLPFAALSTGQQRRIGFCRLLLAPRPLWLLDEPTSGLDAAGAELFAGLSAAHLAAGGLIAAATHLPLGLQAAVNLRLEDYRPKADGAALSEPLLNTAPAAWADSAGAAARSRRAGGRP